jgi:hypothetical protein
LGYVDFQDVLLSGAMRRSPLDIMEHIVRLSAAEVSGQSNRTNQLIDQLIGQVDRFKLD